MVIPLIASLNRAPDSVAATALPGARVGRLIFHSLTPDLFGDTDEVRHETCIKFGYVLESSFFFFMNGVTV
jgi:hypothetical protein